MKKILSVALSTAMAFSMFASVAFGQAGLTDVNAQYNYLKDKGIFNGYPDGQAHLDRSMTRAEFAKVITKTLGLKEVTGVYSYNDKNYGANHWAAPYVEAVTAEGIMEGQNTTKKIFGLTSNVTVQEMATVLVRALKLEIPTETNNTASAWAKGYVQAAINAGLVKADANFQSNASRELLVGAAYAVDQKVAVSVKSYTVSENGKVVEFTMNDGKTVKVTLDKALEANKETEVKFTYNGKEFTHKVTYVVTAAAVESVSAINNKTIEVKFNTAVDTEKATITVKRGTASPTVKAITFSKDKTSATIEFSTTMLAGDYTVTVAGLTEEALTGITKVEAEKLTSIEFLSDIAVISGNNVTTTVVAKNQYGETINTKLNTSTNTNITGTTSKGTSVAIDSKGLLTVNGTSGLFKADDKVVVTVVDANTGISASKTLTVAQSATVNSITVGEIKTDDEELAKKTLNLANYTGNEAKFYIPVEVRDQYGNTLNAATLNNALTVTSSNTKIVKPATTKFEDTKDGVVLKFTTSDSTATYGTATLTFVAASTGKTATASVTIKEDAKLDVVTLEANSLVQGVATELPISITNTYGEQVNLFDVTVGGSNSSITLDTNTTITATNATLTVERDYINKTAKLKVTPSAKNVTIQVTSATGKPQVLILTAEDAPVVSAIKGLDKDFAYLLANDGSLTTNLKDAVKFVDQYGNDIAAPTFDENDSSAALDFTIKEKDLTNAVTTLSNGVVTASTTAGTEVYEVILKDASGNELDKLEVTVGVVDADKLNQFEINDVNKFYTGNTSADHNQTVEVFGLSNGKKVVVNQNMIKDVYASNGLTGFSGASFTASRISTDGKDVASTLTVLVANNNATYTVTKEVTYSDAAPVSTSLAVKYDDKDVTGAVQVPIAELNKGFTPKASVVSKLQFVAKDQYGVQVEKSKYTFVTTNSGTTGTVTSEGVGSGFVQGDAGKSLQLNVRVDGISTAIKVIAQ